MFWNRSAREARRQKVLDELLALDPDGRRRRLDEAVVAGDVREVEIDQALRLVSRLDALRVMQIPGTHDQAGTTPSGSEADAEAGATPGKVPGRRRNPKKASAKRERRSISVLPERTGAAGSAAPGRARPKMKAAAARKAGSAGSGPRRRRLRIAAASTAAQQLVSGSSIPIPIEADGDLEADAPILVVAGAPAGSDDSAREQWPDISWLRP